MGAEICALTTVAVNRDLLTTCPISLGCCPAERAHSPTADISFQSQIVTHLQEWWAMGKVSCTGLWMENHYIGRGSLQSLHRDH